MSRARVFPTVRVELPPFWGRYADTISSGTAAPPQRVVPTTVRVEAPPPQSRPADTNGRRRPPAGAAT